MHSRTFTSPGDTVVSRKPDKTESTEAPAWADRVKAVLQATELNRTGLARLLAVYPATVGKWARGKNKPSAPYRTVLERLETDPRLARKVSPFVQILPKKRRRRQLASELPEKGPLGYDRYLELMDRPGLFVSPMDGDEEEETRPFHHSEFQFRVFQVGPAKALKKKASAARLKKALDLLDTVQERFKSEIIHYPITQLAVREHLNDAEVRILVRLAREDTGVFEGKGICSGYQLVRIAAGQGGNRLKVRESLNPKAKLRRHGYIEKIEREGRINKWIGESDSVVEQWYYLTEKGRKKVLGKLLKKSILEETDKVATKDGLVREPRFSLGSVILPSEHLKALEAVAAEIEHRDILMDEWGLSAVVRYGTGSVLLFEGPPGTGKTMSAEAFAGRILRPMITANMAQLLSKWIGETEQQLVELFSRAKKEEAVLFIDEADSLLSTRDNTDRSWELQRVNTLLKEIESFDGVCILATNIAPVLDKALASRVSLRLRFELPDAMGREKIWRKHLPKSLPLTDDVDLADLSRRYEISGRDIKQAVLTAARNAVQRKGKCRVVTMTDLCTAAESRAAVGDKKRVVTGFRDEKSG